MIGFGDSRKIAMTTPSETPMAIAKIVNRIVVLTPLMIGGRNMLSIMNDHWNALLVTSRWTNMPTSKAMTAIATQRHGCRTGTALIASGRARSVVDCIVIQPACQEAGGLTDTDEAGIAPAWTPQFVRIL